MNVENIFTNNGIDHIEENLLSYIKGGLSNDNNESSGCCDWQFSCNHRGKQEDLEARNYIQFS